MPLPPPLLEDLRAEQLVRVDDPDRPDAIARSATGSILAAPPDDGTPWRPEAVGWNDVVVPEAGERFELGDPAAVTNADLWHAAGFRGQGVKVAVFDNSWFGGLVDEGVLGEVHTRDCLITPSCEAPLEPLATHFDIESGVHGWACAEAVRRMAPDVELYAVRAGTGTLFENAVQWAIREHIDVITMSLSFYNESFYDGTGPTHAGLVALEEANVLLVTSAGNDGGQHWHSRWTDLNGDDRLDGDGDDGIWLFADADAQIYVTWNQFHACGATDLGVHVTDGDGVEFQVADVAQEWLPAEDGMECAPVEKFTIHPRQPDWFHLEVVRNRGPVVGLEVDLINRSGELLAPVRWSSVVDPQADPLAVAVGAVRASTYWTSGTETYSSEGPNRVGHPKPDLAGPDGLDAAVYSGVGFFGTSASAPAVAGMLAVVMSSDPSLTPREALHRVQGWARGDGALPIAPDPKLGAGRARLPVLDPAPPPCGRRPLWMGMLPFVLFRWRRR